MMEKIEQEKSKSKQSKVKKKLEEKLESITRLEYEEALINILQAKKKGYQEILDIFTQYQWDKENYYIKYFKKGRIINYTKYRKKKVGFK